MRTLILLLYITMTIWTPYLIYFWISVMALCVSPFLFNPHQFSFADFIIDYREFLRWMSRGNSRTHANSWVGYCRLSRTKITGFKRKKLGLPSEKVRVPEGERFEASADILPLPLAVERRGSCRMEGGLAFRNHQPYLLGHHLRRRLPLCQLIQGGRSGAAGVVEDSCHLPWPDRVQHGFAHHPLPGIIVLGSMRK